MWEINTYKSQNIIYIVNKTTQVENIKNDRRGMY